MKTPLIALVASMALVSAAQADSKFYGKMNVTAGYNDSAEAFGVESNASRVGIKGSEELASSKLIYQAEYQIDVDGDGGVLGQRNTYIGLAYKNMGTVKMGIMDTPLKKSQGKYDLFNDIVDIKKVLDGENRIANSVNYTTAMSGPFQASLSFLMAEEVAGKGSDGISASVTYKEGDVYAAVALDDSVPGKQTSNLRATVIYSLGDMRIGGILNKVDTSDVGPNDDELAVGANVSFKMGMNTLKAQVESGDQVAVGATSLSLGVDRKLAKSTKAFAYLNQFDKDAEDVLALAVGLEHKF